MLLPLLLNLVDNTYSYSPVSEAIADMIAEFGRTATLVKTGRIAAGWERNTGDNETLETKVVFTRYNARDREDSLIHRTDVKCLVAGQPRGGFDMTNVDRVEIGGTNIYSVVSTSVVRPDTINMLHILQLRKHGL